MFSSNAVQAELKRKTLITWKNHLSETNYLFLDKCCINEIQHENEKFVLYALTENKMTSSFLCNEITI